MAKLLVSIISEVAGMVGPSLEVSFALVPFFVTVDSWKVAFFALVLFFVGIGSRIMVSSASAGYLTRVLTARQSYLLAHHLSLLLLLASLDFGSPERQRL